MLQRLLTTAESSLSAGTANGRAALESVSEAFEVFRHRQEMEEEPIAETPEHELRRAAVRTLARLLAEVDAAVSRGDPKSAASALELLREALDVARRLDDLAHTSGVRQRFGAKVAK